MMLRDQPDTPDTPDPLTAATRGESQPACAAPSKQQTSSAAKLAQLTVVAKDAGGSAGRRRKREDERAQLEKLGAAQFLEEELAEALGITPEALAKLMTGRTKARLAYEKGRAAGMMALRSAQLKLAETSAPMAIFLGRVYLGQSERPEVDPRESNEIAEVAQSVRDRLAALVAEANRNRGPYPGDDRGNA